MAEILRAAEAVVKAHDALGPLRVEPDPDLIKVACAVLDSRINELREALQ